MRSMRIPRKEANNPAILSQHQIWQGGYAHVSLLHSNHAVFCAMACPIPRTDRKSKADWVKAETCLMCFFEESAKWPSNSLWHPSLPHKVIFQKKGCQRRRKNNCKNRFFGRNKWCSGSRIMEWLVHKLCRKLYKPTVPLCFLLRGVGSGAGRSPLTQPNKETMQFNALE